MTIKQTDFRYNADIICKFCETTLTPLYDESKDVFFLSHSNHATCPNNGKKYEDPRNVTLAELSG